MDINKRINKIAETLFDSNNVRFAEKMGTSEANIRNYRSKTVPKIDFIIKLHEILEISFEWLLLNKGTLKKSSYDLSKGDSLSIVNEERLHYITESKDEIIKALREALKAHEKTIKSNDITIKSQEKTIEALEMLIEQMKRNEKGHIHTPVRTV